MDIIALATFLVVSAFRIAFSIIGNFISDTGEITNPILVIMGIAFLSASIYINIVNIKNMPNTVKRVKSMVKSFLKKI